ncbi:hypothetical protein [Lignipirellula cremea]|uniref:hypothetical protein n=1 Tax=Lignipirellula cremea TaxID=2528010 RepID=UPI0011A2767A|nr:hypothetical protein [Lignipirellula cremea]
MTALAGSRGSDRERSCLEKRKPEKREGVFQQGPAAMGSSFWKIAPGKLTKFIASSRQEKGHVSNCFRGRVSNASGVVSLRLFYLPPLGLSRNTGAFSEYSVPAFSQ